MTSPKFTDLKRFLNRLLNASDWNYNFQTIVNWLNGTTPIDVTFNDVTATHLIGDGSQITGLAGVSFETASSNIKMNGVQGVGVLSTTPRADHIHPSDVNKADVFAKGDFLEASSSIFTITGGTNAVIGGGIQITAQQATSTTNGYLTSTDWSLFHGKQSALPTGTSVILYRDATGDIITLAIGLASTVLVSGGVNAPLYWGAGGSSSGGVGLDSVFLLMGA